MLANQSVLPTIIQNKQIINKITESQVQSKIKKLNYINVEIYIVIKMQITGLTKFQIDRNLCSP